MDSKKISISFDKKTLKLDQNVKTFEQLKSFIKQKFDTLPEKIKIYYIDSDNDEITISCDADLESFQDENEDIQIKISSYLDSDATESEIEDEDDEEIEEIENQLSDLNEHPLQQFKKTEKTQYDDPPSSEDLSNFDKKANYFEMVKKGDYSSSNEDLSNFGKGKKHKIMDKCFQSNQSRVKSCDSQDQSYEVEQIDNSTQTQIVSKDNQSQTYVQSRDYSLQTQQIEFRDNQIQTKVESCDSELQADVIQQQDFSPQTYPSNQQGLESQLNILNLQAVGINNTEIQYGKEQIQGNQCRLSITQEYEQRIRVLEQGQELMMKKFIEQERNFEERLLFFQNGIQCDNVINRSIEERIKQLVDSRVNEHFPEYSRTNQDSIRYQDKVTRFDRIFQEISSQFNKLTQMTYPSQFCITYDELTRMLIQKLEIARDMYKKELFQNQQYIRIHSSLNNLNNSKKTKESNQMEQEVKQLDLEERKENPQQNKQVPSYDGSQQKPADPPLIMREKESNVFEDDCIYEERLKNYQERLRRESIDEEENIKKILKQKEQEALRLNEEVIESKQKDYPKEVVEKAKQIAALTQEKPNKYLQYVLDYKDCSINDLIDMLFYPNIMDKYQEE